MSPPAAKWSATPTSSAMSTSRSRVESRKPPKRVVMPWWRATTPSIRSKTPPATISRPPVRKLPRASAVAAISETRVPITVSRFGLTRRWNRKGNQAWSQPSTRSPNTDLTTDHPSRRGVWWTPCGHAPAQLAGAGSSPAVSEVSSSRGATLSETSGSASSARANSSRPIQPRRGIRRRSRRNCCIAFWSIEPPLPGGTIKPSKIDFQSRNPIACAAIGGRGAGAPPEALGSRARAPAGARGGVCLGPARVRGGAPRRRALRQGPEDPGGRALARDHPPHRLQRGDRDLPGHHRQLPLQRLRAPGRAGDRRRLLRRREVRRGPLLLPRLRRAPPAAREGPLHAAAGRALPRAPQALGEPRPDTHPRRAGLPRPAPLQVSALAAGHRGGGALARPAPAAGRAGARDRQFLHAAGRVGECRQPLAHAAQRVSGPRPGCGGAVPTRRVLYGDESHRGGRQHLPGDRAELPGQRVGRRCAAANRLATVTRRPAPPGGPEP